MRYQCLPDWRKRVELVRLLDLPNPPKQLYYLGRWDPEIFNNCVAVVGSRRMTEYGRRAIETIIPELVFAKKTIVSGFMYGVDQYAQEICLANGGKTIAVLGWGISWPLEGDDQKLSQSIIDSGGLLLSEWETQKPTLWTFPVRNRLVAALSSEVIVVEADQKSGSLITANLALKLKRKLWAVPGPITSRVSSATNALIADGKASMWRNDDFKPRTLSDDPLLQELGDESFTADELARKLGKSISEIGAQLSILTLSGQLTERGGKYFARKN